MSIRIALLATNHNGYRIVHGQIKHSDGHKTSVSGHMYLSIGWEALRIIFSYFFFVMGWVEFIIVFNILVY
jgi:hypothetical protein